jgi:hypothetical protein
MKRPTYLYSVLRLIVVVGAYSGCGTTLSQSDYWTGASWRDDSIVPFGKLSVSHGHHPYLTAGQSGSPAFLDDGKLVGLAKGVFPRSAMGDFAQGRFIDAEEIREFLSRFE